MSINITPHFKDINWEGFSKSKSPFLRSAFFECLTISEGIGGESGWQPVYFEDRESSSFMYTYIKNHSYGEYIFDWDWANGFAENGMNYYPKLTSMIPMTSATSPHFIGTKTHQLMESYEEFYNSKPFSSSHFLFIQESEKSILEDFGYVIRDSFQYHFFNEPYKSFEHFLEGLRSRKAKQIRKERRFDKGIEFNRITGEELTSVHAKEMFRFYLSTIDIKQAIPYLSEEFFLLSFEKCRDSILYVQATQMGNSIAGALYFFGDDRLYGRYWGAEVDVSNLHFELCYYQGIEFCIERGLEVFEAGAQGEHKIGRGFKPVLTFSAHKIKNPGFHEAIKKYVDNEREQIKNIIPKLEEKLPFKK